MYIPENSFICPAGLYGQSIYLYINNKKNILGFIDNNPNRHNKKLYGTDKLVYSPSSINYDNSTIIICDCPYKDEIINNLYNISSSIKFIYI